MASLRPPRRYMEQIARAEMVRSDEVQRRQAERLQEANEVAEEAERRIRGSLASSSGLQGSSLVSQAARLAHRHRNDMESGLSELDATYDIAEPSHPAPLLTPPPSPIASRVDSRSKQQDSSLGDRKTKELHEALQDCISEITDLRSRLEITQSEVRELRKEHQRAADEHARAIIINDEKAVEERKAFEERAMKVIKEKNETIGGLQSEIEEGRRREGELREQLAEAEGRVEARRRVIAATDKTIADRVRGESESISETIKNSASKHRRNGMGDRVCGFYRGKGERKGPLRAGIQLLRESA